MSCGASFPYKALAISSASKSWTYDGQTHTEESYAVTYGGDSVAPDESGRVFTLPTGDKLTITPTAAGVKDYAASYKENYGRCIRRRRSVKLIYPTGVYHTCLLNKGYIMGKGKGDHISICAFNH